MRVFDNTVGNTRLLYYCDVHSKSLFNVRYFYLLSNVVLRLVYRLFFPRHINNIVHLIYDFITVPSLQYFILLLFHTHNML